MTIHHKPENTNKSHAAHPSLGKAFEFTNTTKEAAHAAGILSSRKFHARPRPDGMVKVITMHKTKESSFSSTHIMKPCQIYEFIEAYGDINGYCPE